MTRKYRGRDDRKGRLCHYGNGIVETFWASGASGELARADGKGGLLIRGYYARFNNGKLIGPSTTRPKAVAKARGETQ